MTPDCKTISVFNAIKPEKRNFNIIKLFNCNELSNNVISRAKRYITLIKKMAT